MKKNTLKKLIATLTIGIINCSAESSAFSSITKPAISTVDKISTDKKIDEPTLKLWSISWKRSIPINDVKT